MIKNKYNCEVCGKEKILTSAEAFEKGWDYPPFIGEFGAVSPRTCPECPMEETAWAALVLKHKTYSELSDKQIEAALTKKTNAIELKSLWHFYIYGEL